MSTKPLLTIGFPVYRDFDGLYFSALDIPMSHPEVCDQIEIVVVDNDPGSPQGQTTKDWVEGHLAGSVRARYVAFPGRGGPAGTKQHCIHQAQGEYVLVMDSHVRVARHGLARLLDYYNGHPDTSDLFSGPMAYDVAAHVVGLGDQLTGYATHMDEVWRGGNLGIWATDPRGIAVNGEPFEVPAMGCGLFSCRTAAFTGFNPDFRGFGGEEYYIHHKTRAAGNKCICLPFLRWVHRFGRPSGVPYPILLWDKVRNYVIGHNELGLPLDGIYQHFVAVQGESYGTMSDSDWEYLLADPVGHITPKESAPTGCGTCGSQAAQLPDTTMLEDLYIRGETAADIGWHVPKLRELAEQCDVIVDLGHRSSASTTAFLAGQPKILHSYDAAIDPIWAELEKRRGNTEVVFRRDSVIDCDIPECDLLFEDSTHTADHVYRSLTKHGPMVRRWIVCHDTEIYGEKGEDGGPGILPALRRFMSENSQWSVVYHTQVNHGLTVLGCRPEDKPALPSLPRMAWNYAKAIAKHAATGAKKATAETVESRMEKCSLCLQRTSEENGEQVLNRCAVCGCYLDEGPGGREGKLEWAESFCPLAQWGPEGAAPAAESTDEKGQAA